ncbi:hypothetical protein OGAPHI_006097 [Ogataea philodendri]|uniref:RING-type E3 ubiquitin transferase n=1 Tax=Ogataea philodendri TaxID=1378263 RepID=A0A9P8NXV8_9ASCO|nr:uncharacterized protein OGAPHI_006097 [Ogataea philodendri]KAH3661918.1 hypothetical protein OGAPHI_006097 [Ogataea philodendri]
MFKLLSFANAPAVVRANQKDSYFESSLLKQLTELAKAVKGTRFVHKCPEELRTLATALYLCLTTLVGSKTLGEEYVDLVYVGRNGRRLPKFVSRLGFILAYTLFPYGVRNLLQKLKSGKGRLSELASKLNYVNLVDLMNLHLAVFYFSGKYYHFAKRLFGLRYAFGYRVDQNQRQARGNYELLGLLIVAQVVFKNYSNLKDFWDKQETAPETGDLVYGYREQKDPVIDLADPGVLPYIPENSRTCMLCLSLMKDPACGECGHVFCWTCIHDWVKERKECPLCRADMRESQLLPLR